MNANSSNQSATAKAAKTSKIKFNRTTCEFERDGKKLRLNEQGAFCLLGWISSVAKRSPMVAKELECFANFSFELEGKNYNSLNYFEEVA